MHPDRNIFHEAARVYGSLPGYVAAFVFGEFALQAVKELTGLGTGATFVAELILWAALAFAAHVTQLFPPDVDRTAVIRRFIPFVWRTAGLLAAALVPCLVLLVALVFAAYRLGSAGEFAVVGGFLASFALLSWLVLSLAGTWLPASVADGDKRLSAALERGRRQFAWTALRLVAPGVLVTASVALALAALLFVESEGSLVSTDYVPDPVIALGTLAAFAIQAYAIVLTAVILSRVYLREEGPVSVPSVASTPA